MTPFDGLVLLFACWRHHPIRTLEQPAEFTAPMLALSW